MAYRLTQIATALTTVGALALSGCGDGGDGATNRPDARLETTIDGGPSSPDASGADAAPPDATPPQVLVSPAAITIDEGDDQQTFTVALEADPGGSVDVSVSSSDAEAATTMEATVSFDSGNFDTPQAVTLVGVDDADADDESVTITASATGYTDGTIAVTVLDNESLHIRRDPAALTIDEAGTGTFEVRLTISPGGGNTVTVNVASADEGAATVTPATLTFANNDFDTPQEVTVSGVDDADADDETVTITLTDADGVLTTRTVVVTVTDDETAAARF
ncbi:hypothetical protein [Haliangium sp.]